MLHSILASQGISQGHVDLSDKKILHGFVWLTTTLLPHGHGLTTGREVLTDSDKDYARRVQLSDRPIHGTHNKQLVRITVDGDWVKNQHGYVTYINLMRKLEQPKQFVKVIGISGWVKPSSLSDAELNRWMKSPKTKEKTWFLLEGTIPQEQFIAIDFMESDDHYVPYDFEKHGRKLMVSSGLIPSSAAMNENLNSRELPELFLSGSIISHCHTPDAEPSIIFRKISYSCIITLDYKKCIFITGNRSTYEQEVGTLIEWMSLYSKEIGQMWNDAKASYHHYNG